MMQENRAKRRAPAAPRITKPRARSAAGVREIFARFDGEKIREPKQKCDRPHREMLEWHWREVFKG